MRRISWIAAVMTSIAALTVIAAPAAAGPPWISVEYPSNPHHPSTRDAAFLVRLYHHSDAITVPVRGRAEGIVDGRRRSVDVRVEKTAFDGIYAVKDLPAETGSWVVVITMMEGETAASAVVALAADGSPLSVTVPSSKTRDGWLVPRAATPRDIDAQLAQAAALTRALADTPAPATKSSGAALPLLIVPIGVVAAAGVRRRVRRARRS